MRIARSAFAGVTVRSLAGGQVTIERGGIPATNISVSFTEVLGPSPKDTTIFGTYSDTRVPKKLDFVGVGDPVPIAVWIVGIAAAACVLIVGVSAITTNCTEICTNTCGAGGVKSCKADTTFVFSYGDDGFEVGCDYDCKVDCFEG
jgi:hypothetical protein